MRVRSRLLTCDAMGGRGGEWKAAMEGGLSQRHACSLCHPLPEAFHVDMDSGLVTTKRPLHSYERFNLTVVATDGGEPPLWGTTMLLVEVIDVNDNRPVFVRPPNGTIVHIKEVRVPQASCRQQAPPHIQPASSHRCAQERKGGPRCEGGETEARGGNRLLQCCPGQC